MHRTEITEALSSHRPICGDNRRYDRPSMRTSAESDAATTVPKARKPPTILDVAAEAGVSKSTVSNVVRGVTEISPETRTRVLEAIERLRYRPNGLARQFVQQRSTMLGVLLDDLSNPNNAQMAQGVERAAFGSGYTTMFCNIEGSSDMAIPGVDVLLSQRVAGIIMLAFIEQRSPAYDALHEAGLPTVFVGLSGWWGDSVGPRDAEGGGWRPGICSTSGTSGSPTSVLPWSSAAATKPGHPATGTPCADTDLRPLPTFVWNPGSRTVRINNRQVPFEIAMTVSGGPHRILCVKRHRRDRFDRRV